MNKKYWGFKKIKQVEYPELSAEIAKKGETQKEIADLLFASMSAVNRKLRGLTDWTVTEIHFLYDHYKKPFEVLFQEKR